MHQHLNYSQYGILRQSILKTLQNGGAKKSQIYSPIHTIHLDIDQVILANLEGLVILDKVLHGLELH